MVRRQLSVDDTATSAGWPDVPATLAARSRRPCSATMPATSASTAASSVTSTTSMPGPGVRSAATTTAPRSRSRRTVASPMPEAPPVTRAIRPLRSSATDEHLGLLSDHDHHLRQVEDAVLVGLHLGRVLRCLEHGHEVLERVE